MSFLMKTWRMAGGRNVVQTIVKNNAAVVDKYVDLWSGLTCKRNISKCNCLACQKKNGCKPPEPPCCCPPPPPPPPPCPKPCPPCCPPPPPPPPPCCYPPPPPPPPPPPCCCPPPPPKPKC